MKTGRASAERKKMPTRGFSLLEMIAAAVLMTSIIAPSLAVMRDAMAKSRELNRHKLLANYAVRTLEDQAALVAANWINETINGDFSADGHANVKYTGTKSDLVADGGLVNRLMHIRVTVYDDANGSSSLDAGELRADYRTKVAKLNSYENEPQ